MRVREARPIPFDSTPTGASRNVFGGSSSVTKLHAQMRPVIDTGQSQAGRLCYTPFVPDLSVVPTNLSFTALAVMAGVGVRKDRRTGGKPISTKAIAP